MAVVSNTMKIGLEHSSTLPLKLQNSNSINKGKSVEDKGCPILF